MATVDLALFLHLVVAAALAQKFDRSSIIEYHLQSQVILTNLSTHTIPTFLIQVALKVALLHQLLPSQPLKQPQLSGPVIDQAL